MKLIARNGLLITFGCFFLMNPARADVGGKITGTVKDQTNAVIPGATIMALNTATGVKQTTKTDEQGSYSFPVLAVGQYEIDVTAEGFKASKTQGLTININTALTADITLQLSEQNESVTVSVYNVVGAVKSFVISFHSFFAVPLHTRSFASRERGRGRPAKRAFIEDP